MPQADRFVDNALFPAVRDDINNNLAALFSNNSGSTAPTSTVAHMDWIEITGDTTATWKKRNSANNAWITVATISGSTIAFEGTLPAQASQSGKFLTTNGTTASWATVTVGGRLLRAPQMLTSGTSYTAPANCVAIYVEAVGGGGGGGSSDNAFSGSNAGGGGGAGGYCAKYFTVVATVAYAYALGAGGVTDGAGGSTTFTVGGTTITAGGGGGGGSGGGAAEGGAGGTCANGDININGGGGGAGGPISASGSGGNSFFGGGAPGPAGNATGVAGALGGGGGSGGSRIGGTGGKSGGAGGAGLIRIWEYS